MNANVRYYYLFEKPQLLKIIAQKGVMIAKQ
jgi:hypothetical protein